MNNHKHSKQLANSVRVAVALCALAAGGGRAAQAGSVAVTTPRQLIQPVLTAQYPSGAGSVVPASFTVAAGGSDLTFTATDAVSGAGFQSFAASAADAAPQFTLAPYGMAGDILENTTYDTGAAAGNTATGPLQIDFQQGVAGFGLLAQDFNRDTETFTLTVFDGAAQIGLFTFGPTPNGDPATDPGDPLGRAVFVGAQADGGDVITRATLSSLSAAVGMNPNNGSNDFAFGRTFVQAAPVPEVSTLIGFGLGVLLCAGLARRVRSQRGVASERRKE